MEGDKPVQSHNHTQQQLRHIQGSPYPCWIQLPTSAQLIELERHTQWRHQGGGMGGQMPPQLEALPPHLPPQSEWDFFFFFFFYFFFFFFFFFFFTYVVSHTSHQFKINISIFCNISFYK